MDSSEIAEVWSPQKEKDTREWKTENTRITPAKGRMRTYQAMGLQTNSGGTQVKNPNGSGSTERSRE